MKIVNIFADQLFSFIYKEGETYVDNEYDRLMELWTDVSYLRAYGKKNNIENLNQFVKRRLRDAEQIQDLLEEITANQHPLEYYFRPLYNSEDGVKFLSLQKGKASTNDGLRLYAIKIDENCFVLTGGAIKMSQAMQGHEDTRGELAKIKKAQRFLQDNEVIDQASFYELISELE